MSLVDETRCIKCKRPFDPPRVVEWGRIGFDLRHALPYLEDSEAQVGRIEAPVCGQCFEVVCGPLSGVSMHPKAIEQLPRAKPSGLHTGSLGSLLGIPLHTDDTLDPGTAELHYRGKRLLSSGKGKMHE